MLLIKDFVNPHIISAHSDNFLIFGVHVTNWVWIQLVTWGLLIKMCFCSGFYGIYFWPKLWSNWKLNNWTDTSRHRMVPRDHNDGFMALYMMLFFLSVLPFSDLSEVSERMSCDQKTKMVSTCGFVPGGPPLVQSPLVWFPLVRILVL